MSKSAKKTSKPTAGSRKRSPARRAKTAPRPAKAAPPRAKTTSPPAKTAPRRAAPESALAAFADLALHLGIRWYVFGAQAVNLHGFPRATADLDLTIDLGHLAPRALVTALDRAGFSARFADDAFVAATRVIPVVHRATELPIDLVLAGPGLEQRFLDEVELRLIAGRQVPVLSPENLIVTKLLASRPKDLQDIRELLASRGTTLNHARIGELLSMLEQALGQSDLVTTYSRLRRETKRR